jgi:hypothetical protein
MIANYRIPLEFISYIYIGLYSSWVNWTKTKRKLETLYKKIFSIMWIEAPSLDDCDLRELQCACHEPAVRDINYTQNDDCVVKQYWNNMRIIHSHWILTTWIIIPYISLQISPQLVPTVYCHMNNLHRLLKFIHGLCKFSNNLKRWASNLWAPWPKLWGILSSNS